MIHSNFRLVPHQKNSNNGDEEGMLIVDADYTTLEHTGFNTLHSH